jgi:hypothetical protein
MNVAARLAAAGLFNDGFANRMSQSWHSLPDDSFQRPTLLGSRLTRRARLLPMLTLFGEF